MLNGFSVRLGVLSVLALLTVGLFLVSITGWYSAYTSNAQINEFNTLVMGKLDKLNNAAIWIIRASAMSHSVMLDREAGRMDTIEKGLQAAHERLDNAHNLIIEILPSLLNDSLFSDAARELEQKFKLYEMAVAQLINSIRAGVLSQYIQLDNNAKTASQAYAVARQALTDLINKRAGEVMQASDQRILHAEVIATVFILVSVMLVVGCWLFLSRQVLKPLGEAGERFREMAEGDLTQPIPESSRNEIGELFRAIAHMQNSQRNTLSHLSKTVLLLTSSAEKLDQVTWQTNEGLQRQNAELEQAVTAVTEMTTAIEEVAGNALSTSQAATASNQLAQSSRQQVGKTLREIEVMSSEVQSTGQVIQHLADQARDIGKVLDVIRSVSEQTNLLALNAAIEAARAGEAGRGFAVVADEVRTLASRTQQSTLEIEQMISSIQISSSSAVNAIHQSNRRALDTLETTRTTGQMLEDMFRAINQITERSQIIANAAEGQAQVAREVDRNLLNIRELAAQSSAGATETSQASEALSGLALEMRNLVQHFRV